jgi:DNA-binding NtrC family response regulator
MKDSLFSKVLELVLEEVPAGRSLVLLSEGEGVLRARLARGIDWEADHDVCRDIVEKAVEAGQPLLIRDFGVHPLYRGHSSVRSKGPASALCLPLLAGGRVGGAFYMDRTAAEPPFNAGDLELLAAAAVFLNHILASSSCGVPAGGGNGNGRMPLLVGQDARFLRVMALVDRVKDSGASVFISGESGTGKEMVARTIHETGSRRSGKFVAVNCGAIPDNLLESELFGYARGAFTGAVRDKVGLIEEADGGTFFLDEIGDLTFPLQAKLLRVLEDGAIRRLGETRTRTVDVRWVSATHKDLDIEVREARFREDLYYRLKIIPIELPPLRERTDDLLPLINHFAERYAREMRRPRPYFSPGALEMLFHYPWPGNVRELQNEVQRSFIMAGENNLIREEFLSPKINPRKETYSDDSRRLRRARSEFEKRFLRESLARCGYRRTRTATEIGISRQGLFKLMKKHEIETP